MAKAKKLNYKLPEAEHKAKLKTHDFRGGRYYRKPQKSLGHADLAQCNRVAQQARISQRAAQRRLDAAAVTATQAEQQAIDAERKAGQEAVAADAAAEQAEAAAADAAAKAEEAKGTDAEKATAAAAKKAATAAKKARTAADKADKQLLEVLGD